MLELIFWPKPLSDESPASLVSRAAFHNGYSSASSFARAIGHNVYISFGSLIKDQKISSFFLEHKDNPYSNHKIFYCQSLQLKATHRIQLSGMTIPSRSCQFRAHFCPQCLQDGYWKFIQDIEYVRVCPYHQVEYIKSCPKCKNKYNWSTVNGPYCKCDFDLRLVEAIHSDDIGPSSLLALFRSGQQAVMDRFFAAVDCLRYQLLTSDKIDEELFLATSIAQKNKDHFYLYILNKIQKHPNLSPHTQLSPWMLSSDQWIRDMAASFALTLRSADHHSCQKIIVAIPLATHLMNCVTY